MKPRVQKKPGFSARQLRRPVPKALNLSQGNTTRGLVDGASFSEWGWVGTEVHSATDIGPQHRAAACGFRKPICKNKQAPAKAPIQPAVPQDPDDDVVVISDDEPECSIKACKSNPNCCNYLGQGKWVNEASARKLFLEAAGFGADPQDESRITSHPVGLKNLGATCYANSIIQVWFQDLEFRAGVYKCIPELSLVPGKTIEESPMYQLQTTFGMLQQSVKKSFNPVKFVECLGIRAAEQQDAQEFSKLFMSHLDNEFKKQQDIPLQSLVTDQFEGKQVYGTRCTRCNKSSEHQSSFLELEVSLTVECKLEERLTASLEDEKLEGDNQYDCSTCGSKQDAFRYQRITHLPPVLHFSVLRFVFDPKDMERKKSKQAINYPLSINMRPYVSGQTSDLWYDLRGVLLHRGSSAYHGHYEAQVFDVTRNKWFLFNDEEVKEIQKEDLLGRQISGVFSFGFSVLSAKDHRSQGSKDAYMLIYGQRDRRPTDTTTINLPKQVSQAVENLNAEHIASCDAYTQRREILEAEFATIRGLKRDIFQTWQISSVDEVSVVLDRENLESWVSGDLDTTKSKQFTRSPTIDNDPPLQGTHPASHQAGRTALSPSPPPLDELVRGSAPSNPSDVQSSEQDTIKPPASITCVHGLLDPSKSNAWERMEKAGAKAVALESTQLSGTDMAPLDWKLKRPKMHKPGFRDPVPNADQFRPDVYCEHGGLVHSQKSREKISTAALQVLQEIFPEFQPPGTETETCSVCEAVAASDREATKEARVKAETERSRLSVLARSPLSTLEAPRLIEGLDYALVPYSFISQWRTWLVKPLTAPRPGSVSNEQFICNHGNLTVDPTEPLDVDGVVCAISIDEWNTIHELYGGGPFIQCSVEECVSGGKDKLWSNLPLCMDCRTLRLSNLDNVSINVYRLAEGESLPWAVEPTTPPKAKPKAADQDVISIDDTDNESPTLSDASPPARAPGNKRRMKPSVPVTYGQRKSKRLRTAATTKRGTTFSISVSKDDTVRDIKRKIEKVEDVLPFYQQLYLQNVELTDDNRTVSQIGLLRTDRLVLRAIEAMDEDDAVAWALTSGDVEPGPARPRAEGRAFGGTLLDGSMFSLPVSEPSTKAPESATKAPESSVSAPEGDHPMTSLSAGPTTPEADTTTKDITPVQEHPGDAEKDTDMEEYERLATLPCSQCTFLNRFGSAFCEICESPLSW
ncbi:hypothetical protein FRC07_002539 [Ceratobasidium sp. 392]|nr:hypothetical protein FRC07_002539 [Ceratobasidium sp. 392]